MPQQITAICATLNPFQNHGTTYQFTPQQLEIMARTAIGVLVSDNFMPITIGKVVSADVIDGRLSIGFELNQEMDLRGLYLVPAVNISPVYMMTEVAITATPADASLPPILPATLLTEFKFTNDTEPTLFRRRFWHKDKNSKGILPMPESNS